MEERKEYERMESEEEREVGSGMFLVMFKILMGKGEVVYLKIDLEN